MLKRTVNYTNFDGEAKSKTLYFNLTKTELVELDGEAEGGLANSMQRIVDAKEANTLISEFKRIILLSYGERSEDGDRFIKSDDIREAFSQTAAFDALFMELAQNEDKASDFIMGIMPADLTSQLQEEINKPRPAPVTPVSEIPGAVRPGEVPPAPAPLPQPEY